jgi:hypothetical protein
MNSCSLSDFLPSIAALVGGGLAGTILLLYWQNQQITRSRTTLLKALKTSNNVNRKLASNNKCLVEITGPDAIRKLYDYSKQVKEVPIEVFTLFPSQLYQETLLGTRYALPETVMELVIHYLALAAQLNFWMESAQLNPRKLSERILFIHQCEQISSVLEKLQKEVDALLSK